jgi:DMSO/TMAO reductase YedYZ molybdopterin-dependent catalytic subunit
VDSSKLQANAIPGVDDLDDGVIVSSDTRRGERLPPNQVRTKKWPILDSKGAPAIDEGSWKLTLTGLVENELSFDWNEFRELPRVKVFADMHCVTRWSRLGNLWEGVSSEALLALARVRPEARYVIAHGYDGNFTTNLPLEAFRSEDVVLADTHDGEPISLEHGGPLRLVVPKLYAWKSAKWIRTLELVETDRAGYWEEGGYHMVGDPWNEERFRR